MPSRYKMPAETRTVFGSKYRYLEFAKTKAKAEKRSDWWRQRGSQGIRLFPFGGGYAIYTYVQDRGRR